ncbi:MAG: hypothetical protein ACYS76_06580 [Planctomycetota bacterium]|jgi:hypothetical protein
MSVGIILRKVRTPPVMMWQVNSGSEGEGAHCLRRVALGACGDCSTTIQVGIKGKRWQEFTRLPVF